MSPSEPKLSIRMRGEKVKFIHDALGVSGCPIPSSEKEKKYFGSGTRKAVKEFQRKHGLKASGEVDKATALRMKQLLGERPVSPEPSEPGDGSAMSEFRVSGRTLKQNGENLPHQKLLAFDVDLRGAAVYRTVMSIEELKRSGGFRLLAETESDRKARYSFTFSWNQIKRAERNKADVIVLALEGTEIIGRSRLINSNDYADTGEVRNLGVIITRLVSERTEHERLMGRLNDFLEKSKVRLSELASSNEQIVFCAGELDEDESKIRITAEAENLASGREQKLSHELLYSVGRQEIRLTWPSLFRKKDDELKIAIRQSSDEKIIREHSKREIDAFLGQVHEIAAQSVLDHKGKDQRYSLDTILSYSLPERKQRIAFMQAVRSYIGDGGYEKFWREYLPNDAAFKGRPELINGILLTQQLTLLTGNHAPLVEELQVNRKINFATDLLELTEKEWKDILKKTGVPKHIRGKDGDERTKRYAELIQNMLCATYPTQKVALMVKNRELSFKDANISEGINAFLSDNKSFDISRSRIHDFDSEIRKASPEHHEEVKNELFRMQRVFQVSTSPAVMSKLMEKNLNSAHSIASIPEKSFLKTFGAELGGEQAAYAVHQKASFISTRTEHMAVAMVDWSHGLKPQFVVSAKDQEEVKTVLQNHVPNYSELFGNPDICECEHCRSVYSPAAYFVDLMRFLWRGTPNDDGKSPLDIFRERRPDLFHLPLTCENTNTLIPYIDLSNEVMEYYTAYGKLDEKAAYDTGETTAEELRANPQNIVVDAYRTLAAAQTNPGKRNAVYPFNLPYHQPLDVIRTYSEHLKTNRYDLMKALQKDFKQPIIRAIEAESLNLSQEEYLILTKKKYDDLNDARAIYEYFGYGSVSDLEKMATTQAALKGSGVEEFLKRSGTKYIDLVELVKSRFINPYQSTLEFLEDVFEDSGLSPKTIHTYLNKIKAGTITIAERTAIETAITKYNVANKFTLTYAEFSDWINKHLDEFKSVITLHEPQSLCGLETTSLRTIENVYSGNNASGITTETWSKIHRFIRLWRKLGWKIHELDLVLYALGESDITPQAISKLSSFVLLMKKMKTPINQLATLWGNIDTYGDKSLYEKLFLNKAVQRIDEAFKPDKLGNYLTDTSKKIADHVPAILAAFRMSDEDLKAILDTATIIENNAERKINPNTDALNLANLSAIYRYVVMSKALKLRVKDFCLLVQLFTSKPFSQWDVNQKEFVDVSPADTLEFYKLAQATKKAGFKPATLQYIFKGTLPAESIIGLDREKAKLVAKTIREAFNAIEQDYPDEAPSPITAEILQGKLSLTFQADVVIQFMGILDGTQSFSVTTDPNLAVIIPTDLSAKYTYVKGSGRLSCIGVMSDAEKTRLNQANASGNFQQAVVKLYEMPEKLITKNFGSVFSLDMDGAIAVLLDHPAQVPASSLGEKLQYVYKRYLPLLKEKLREDAITKYIAALIGLSDEATSILIKKDMQTLIKDLSQAGHSATYFSDTGFNNVALQRIDSEIKFDWSTGSPDATVPADNFSVRWESFIAPSASGEYTLITEVAEQDESFNLYLDDVLILSKPAGNAMLSWENVVALNASQMPLLKLEYTETSQKASIKLSWKTPTTAIAIIPSSAAYPAGVIDKFIKFTELYHRAAKFISGFKLNERELYHLVKYGADFASIDFKTIRPEHWLRINRYANLRNAVPQAQATLINVFGEANKTNPSPTVGSLQELLYRATAWDTTNLDYLVNTYYSLTANDFKNEIKLSRIYEAMQLVYTTGISAEKIAKWAAPEADFDKLYDASQQIKNTVKAKYEEQDWLQVAGGLSDKIRENQKQALISYLLTKPELRARGLEDADGLFEYFLIDVQMGSCMDSSRIVQANSSIQLFVARCLLNLESERSTGIEKGVSPGSIDSNRWEWMKNYRVWEANRKVFLYPENWLEPEWRDDQSPIFKAFVSELVQNDITERTVENAFRNYLSKLNELANLEVCGMYQDMDTEIIHVFARTHNAPYQYYYRTWNKYRKWSAWENVPLDIRSIDDGENSGVHLIPVVWKKRLFLFWPEFLEKQKESSSLDQKKTMWEAADNPPESFKPTKYWEIRLAWSEYADGKWTPKQLTKEFLEEEKNFDAPKTYRFDLSLDSNTQQLSISYFHEIFIKGQFVLADIQSKVQKESNFLWGGPITITSYTNHFMKRERYGVLDLKGNGYLQATADHKLLYSSQIIDFESTVNYPFFYHDAYRTYFVRPVDIIVMDALKAPEKCKPLFPQMVVDGMVTIPDNIPNPPGPDDYNPADILINPDPVDILSDRLNDRIGKNQSIISPRSFTNPSPYGNAPVYGAMKIMSYDSSKKVMADSQKVGESFSGLMTIDKIYNALWPGFLVQIDKGLQFHIFYHPNSSQFVTNLNRYGLDGLMQCDTNTSSDFGISNDNGSIFTSMYKPNPIYVPEPSDFKKYTYYKENVCFDPYGANSIYNWELFSHAPLYIATRLSKNGKYAEAMKWFHYIFDPTTDEMPLADQSETSRYWKVLPFKTTPAESLQDWFMGLQPNINRKIENDVIAEWRDNPFRPHLVARNRPVAYMKHVVLKYVENLISWGDQLFRRDTWESINEALQIYVLADHILGPRPQFVPKRGNIKAETYATLEPKLDDFSNALVQLENLFPYSSEIPVASSSYSGGLLGIGSAFYFCIPNNDKLLNYWDTVAGRLYKIRHCMNIDGVERRLALFEPPIEPAALVQAMAQGLSLGSILSDLSSPPPIYRFTYLIQKANDFCAEVKSLGSSLLSALEKKDSEELSRFRATHETTMLESMTAIKERQILEVKANKDNLLKSRITAEFKLKHYIDLLGNQTVTPPEAPTISATLIATSQLPADTNIPKIETDVDGSLVASDERGVKLIPKEKEDLDKSHDSMTYQQDATGMESLAALLSFIPTFSGNIMPFGCGPSISFGGSNLGSALSAFAKASQGDSQVYSYKAAHAAKMAGFIRREQDWTLQANLAARDIIQLDKQITAADIRIQVAEKELENHKRQIENAKEVEQFLKDKFTNQELYQWMKEQLFAVYKQSYNMAYDMAKKAEKAYRYELGNDLASFIQYGYWDNTYQGLMSGERLQFALRQMEKSYIEENRRELELTKHFSLFIWNPLELQKLKETGQCYVSIPEELFDLDFQGHYFRRIKAVRITIPCVAGPYTTVNCTLRLLKNTIRINTDINGEYAHNNDEDVWIDDDRFKSSNVLMKAIATTTGQNDAGMFELNFRDERYLPFEGAGAISEWKIELTYDKENPTNKDLRQFDYSTISDVIIHLSYTAREDAGLFKTECVKYIKKFLNNPNDLITQSLMRMFSLKHEFPTEWHKFLHPSVVKSDQVLNITIGKERFPFFTQHRNIAIMQIDVLARTTKGGDYNLILSITDADDNVTTSSQIPMPEDPTFGNIQKVTLIGNAYNINVEHICVDKSISLKLKHNTSTDFKSLGTNPDEVKDIVLVLHYKLTD